MSTKTGEDHIDCVFGGEPIESCDGESLEGIGETRVATGTIYTDKLFTGQREITGLGIYHYGARFCSPKLGRFLSPDTVVLGAANPQNLNRFSYTVNNPLRYTDPTRHMIDAGGGCGGGGGQPLSMPNLNTDYYQLMTNGLYDVPQWCGWFDCALSAASFFASAFTFAPPPIDAIAFGADVVVTFWSVLRTNEDYRQGEISQTRQYALNITGIVGTLPATPETPWTGAIGTGSSFINLLMTAIGIPN